ncbi:hypothetical protein [Cellvibrio sp. PSBB006]|uniref:hypothetical protein n=1 Tax=Cellvibrio sp. PSBB006 TaxID=1987723 RepID=UPI000B3BA7ED|nr:hypothetical protein [Cellvibrio sp. PSBB006]ARU27792.1 hypothetical protein CBR65_10340 [Cellvibrio sp. PSBB006]
MLPFPNNSVFFKAVILVLSANSFQTLAADISCTGTVTWVMGDHPNCTDGNGKKQLAFKITGSDNWLCNNSDAASSLVLSAKVAEKPLLIYMNSDNGETCATRPHYVKPNYTIMK